MKQNKWTILMTSAVTLLPILVGLLLWKRLPEQVPIHFGVTGEADSFASKGIAVFLLPCVMLALHLFSVFLTDKDPKRQNYTPLMKQLVLWLVPVLSLVLAAVLYTKALDAKVEVEMVEFAVFGMLFLVLGNYLPKCRPNYTLGFRLPWTLDDEENWTKTHRMAGPVWMAAGFVLLVTAFLPVSGLVKWVTFLAVTLVGLTIPTVCSYRFYKKKKAEQQ